MKSEDTPRPPRKAELSKVPSWIMLGFAVGALFVFLLKRELADNDPPPPQPVAEIKPIVSNEPSLTERKGEPSLSSIEAVWAMWGGYAIWEGEVTEVALWNTSTLNFKDCFEVTRRNDHVYFRSIPHLTRPVADRGLGNTSPLQFTSPAPPARSR